MNQSLIEREMAFAQAKVNAKQRPFLAAFIEDQKYKAFMTGLVVGALLAMIGVILSIVF